MFTLFRFARRVSENPKILIPIIALAVTGFIIEHTLLGSGSNPLPAPEAIAQVMISENFGDEDGPARVLGMKDYTELRDNLDGAQSLIHSGTGERVATLHLRMKSGETHWVKLYEWGLIRTPRGLFEGADSEKTGRLSSIILRLAARE